MSKYTNLKVWQQAHKFVLRIYRITSEFPAEEKYALASQLRRAASSIPINVAEGSGRAHVKEFMQFVNIARGSASEVEYELLLCRDLGYLSDEEYISLDQKINEISSMLFGLRQSLQKKLSNKR